MKEHIREVLIKAGASAVGFAKAGEIDPSVDNEFKHWLKEGNHGEMTYLERHAALRQHTDSVLEGARTVISLAFNYKPKEWRNTNLPIVAAYAYGEDYHIVLREVLQPVVKELIKKYGGSWRICIDSAPLAERYWAIKAGIGKKGLNGSVIVDGCGSMCFLVEILTTINIPQDEASSEICSQCGLCQAECPGKAIKGDGTIDARKCINYLSIEKRGELTGTEQKLIKEDSGYLYGCDKCFRICPYNLTDSSLPPSLFPSKDKIKTVTPQLLIEMDKEKFLREFNRSPFIYAGYDKLLRNAGIIQTKETENH